MTASTFKCFVIAIPRLSPAMRLAQARDLARSALGWTPTVWRVHPETFAETEAPEGVKLEAGKPAQRYDFCVAVEVPA